ALDQRRGTRELREPARRGQARAHTLRRRAAASAPALARALQPALDREARADVPRARAQAADSGAHVFPPVDGGAARDQPRPRRVSREARGAGEDRRRATDAHGRERALSLVGDALRIDGVRSAKAEARDVVHAAARRAGKTANGAGPGDDERVRALGGG